MRSITAAAIFAAVLGAGLVLRAPAARAQGTYAIDQRFGTIEFTVDHLGMFASHGTFQRFDGQLVIDPATPSHIQVAVQVDARSVAMPWKDAETMVRSPDYFDVSRYPLVRFTSTNVQPRAAGHYAINGMLEIRGISQPQTLDATLVGRHPDPANNRDVAEFVVTGKLNRTAFGMVADQPFVSADVDLRIVARVALDRAVLDPAAPAHAG